jgi:lysozyme
MRLRPPNYFILFFSLLIFGCASQQANNIAANDQMAIVKPHCYQDAASEFTRWNKANGKVLNGLTKRRQDEMNLFLTGCNP